MEVSFSCQKAVKYNIIQKNRLEKTMTERKQNKATKTKDGADELILLKSLSLFLTELK
jgi:hypothetical protein